MLLSTQVNLLETTFASEVRTQGIKDFLDYVTNSDDTWVIPIQEAIAWIRTPVRNADAADDGFVC